MGAQREARLPAEAGGSDRLGTGPGRGNPGGPDRARTLADLRELLADHQRRHRAAMPGEPFAVRSTGLEALDALLPQGGLAPGSLVELLRDEVGGGVLSMALWLARSAASPRLDFSRSQTAPAGSRRHHPIIVLDMQGDFYPPALVAMGFDLERVVVVHPDSARTALWAAEQSLRCPAVGAVVASLERVSDGDARRLQLAAEQGGTMGLLVRPSRAAGRTFAAVRMRIEGMGHSEAEGLRDSGIKGLSGEGAGPAMKAGWNAEHTLLNPSIPESLNPCRSYRSFRITLVYLREGMPGSSCVVELPDEADFVSAPSGSGVGALERSLAASLSEAQPRSSRATG